MTISALADFPEVIPELARWSFDEWHDYDGRPLEAVAAQLAGNLNRDCLPITFVAHSQGALAGTVSLDLSDLPGWDHLTPWLASLYVRAPFRGQDIGAALVQHAQDFASARGIRPLHLWTPGPTRLYERCGWRAFASATCAGRPITLMRFPADPPQAKPGDPLEPAASFSPSAVLNFEGKAKPRETVLSRSMKRSDGTGRSEDGETVPKANPFICGRRRTADGPPYLSPAPFGAANFFRR
jgi:GNAT superfamily N-acetyltransferase